MQPAVGMSTSMLPSVAAVPAGLLSQPIIGGSYFAMLVNKAWVIPPKVTLAPPSEEQVATLMAASASWSDSDRVMVALTVGQSMPHLWAEFLIKEAEARVRQPGSGSSSTPPTVTSPSQAARAGSSSTPPTVSSPSQAARRKPQAVRLLAASASPRSASAKTASAKPKPATAGRPTKSAGIKPKPACRLKTKSAGKK